MLSQVDAFAKSAQLVIGMRRDRGARGVLTDQRRAVIFSTLVI
jgi:hypothetical protein